ncbi:MAG: undecaprenyldiphospho-muramoylpentapeptide beta-N-acetylglucosaminyltransferase, partial [Deltaproteobacteria bacterium]|nr:undecaprenyldiphospho-muramoylpentapeptide beta-N-acetylglucosaminyltransferase [Deltaproteobacteria bacterium]
MMVAGGGTGGHLFPGVAVAKEISRRFEGTEILFVTGKRKMESEVLRKAGFRQTSVAVEGMKGRGLFKGAWAALKLPWSFLESLWIIRGFSPHLVLGVGGYSAGPVCLAARVMGVPSAIHEQNSFPGVTNRLLCRVVNRVFISFEGSRKHLSGASIHLTGNPIRAEFVTSETRLSRNGKLFTVAVVGGSQGARAINSAFVEALALLKERNRPCRVIHQTGELDYERTAALYKEKGLEAEVRPFVQDMAGVYRDADLVVSRAGAGAVFEMAAMGKPSLLIPYPFSANRHQETNAQFLVEAGAAEMILQENLTGEVLA